MRQEESIILYVKYYGAMRKSTTDFVIRNKRRLQRGSDNCAGYWKMRKVYRIIGDRNFMGENKELLWNLWKYNIQWWWEHRWYNLCGKQFSSSSKKTKYRLNYSSCLLLGRYFKKWETGI